MTVLSPLELGLVTAVTLALAGIAIYQAWELHRWRDRAGVAQEFAQEALQHLAFIAECPEEIVPPMRKVLRKWLRDRGFECSVIAVDGPQEKEDGSGETQLPVM